MELWSPDKMVEIRTRHSNDEVPDPGIVEGRTRAQLGEWRDGAGLSLESGGTEQGSAWRVPLLHHNTPSGRSLNQ